MKISTWISSTPTLLMIHANYDATIITDVNAIKRMSKAALVDGSIAKSTSKFSAYLKRGLNIS